MRIAPAPEAQRTYRAFLRVLILVAPLLGAVLAALASAAGSTFWMFFALFALVPTALASIAFGETSTAAAGASTYEPAEDRILTRSASVPTTERTADLSWIGSWDSGRSDLSELVSDFPAAMAALRADPDSYGYEE